LTALFRARRILGLADWQHVFQALVRAWNHVDRDQFAHAPGSRGAGAGELIYSCRGRESSFPFLPKEVPTDSTIVGIVDSIDLVGSGSTAPVRPAKAKK